MASLRDLVLCQDPDGAQLLARLHDYAEAHEGVVDGIEGELAPLWEAHDRTVARKAEATAWVVRELEARANARRNAAKELTEAAKREEKACERIREYVLLAMREAGVPRMAGETCEWRRGKNGGLVPLVIDVQVAELPEAFVRTKISLEPDKDAIRAALERGDDVPGCRLGERGERLTLK
jgi:hypothetical protein